MNQVSAAILAIIAGIATATLIVYLVGGDDQIYGQEMFMCFATKELADDFLKQFPDVDVTIGCPEFNLSDIDKNRTQDEGK